MIRNKRLVAILVSMTLLGILAIAGPYLQSIGWTLWWIDAVTPAPGATKIPLSTVEAATERVLAQEIHREMFYEKACLQLAFEYNRPQSCKKILQTGLALFPTSWRLAFLYGYVNTHFLHEVQEGIYYYRLAAQHPDAPPFVRGLGKKKGEATIQ
jgi:hypothetical protein